MKIIKLTSVSDGSEVFVNPEAITHYFRYGGSTCIRFAGPDSTIHVRETPGEIVKRVENVYA